MRRESAAAVTRALEPGLRTRAFVFNTLLVDKATDDRLRSYEHWLAARNLANEASDESVAALVTAVTGRYELARRWYRLKARLLGIDRLADYDRMAPLAVDEEQVDWQAARELVLDAYGSFSPSLGALAGRFFDERWIDAPPGHGKRGGAFCAYTVPSVHPYVLLNFTGRRRDVLILAHELGHGVHAALAAQQGIFQQGTPLTLAETASVFGEALTFGRLLETSPTPAARLALLAEDIEGAIATVFRQVAMNRFEQLVHTERREVGELSVERFGELWAQTQTELLGDAVEVTDDYRSWWSYIPHFINTPGYVYAYAYGQLLALSVYERYLAEGAGFEERYLELLRSGGSRSPQELGEIVGIDLRRPGLLGPRPRPRRAQPRGRRGGRRSAVARSPGRSGPGLGVSFARANDTGDATHDRRAGGRRGRDRSDLDRGAQQRSSRGPRARWPPRLTPSTHTPKINTNVPITRHRDAQGQAGARAPPPTSSSSAEPSSRHPVPVQQQALQLHRPLQRQADLPGQLASAAADAAGRDQGGGPHGEPPLARSPRTSERVGRRRRPRRARRPPLRGGSRRCATRACTSRPARCSR